MKIYAYREIYLPRVQAHLGEAFEYAVYDCNIAGQDFVNMFLGSAVCKGIQTGDVRYIAGKSGIELAREVVWQTTGKAIDCEAQIHYERTPAYWIGWAVAYYQWWSNRKFADIFEVLPYEQLEKMYYVLHEADISKFVEIVDTKVRSYFTVTNLKRFRLLWGYSQAKLAELSGISLRSIQMYEQRRKDINKASVETVYSLAKTLGCTVEDLLER